MVKDPKLLRAFAACEAMSIEAGLLQAPPGYDPEEAARLAGYTRQEIVAIVQEEKEEFLADEIEEAIEESHRDPRRH